MNKLTRKLFRYFALLECLLAVIVFSGFCAVFHHYTITLHEEELKARAETIASKLEDFMNMDMPQSGKGAYLKFLDDISMADTYIVTADGSPVLYGRNHESLREPTEDANEFAQTVFQPGSYVQKHEKGSGGNHVMYTGMPVWKNNEVTAAVVIIDEDTFDRNSFFQAVDILGVCLVLALMLSAGVSYYLSRRFMRPIHRIACTTRELTLGNYTAKTEIEDSTELGELAKETDILAEKLEAARLESQRLEQLQKDYFADISHELRTPVAVIRSSLEAICDGVVQGEKAAEYHRQMLEESIYLARLVNDMLELSRLQNNDFPIEKEPMNVLSALDDAIRAVRVIAGQKRIQIQYDRMDEVWSVEGDYGRLRQMFVASLDNAIKFSDEGQKILITAVKSGLSGTIAIRDYGCGIPGEDLENIFRKFYRSSNSRKKGSGLGLAIIKSIGDRHSINVRIISTPGEGTQICFHIPLIQDNK